MTLSECLTQAVDNAEFAPPVRQVAQLHRHASTSLAQRRGGGDRLATPGTPPKPASTVDRPPAHDGFTIFSILLAQPAMIASQIGGNLRRFDIGWGRE